MAYIILIAFFCQERSNEKNPYLLNDFRIFNTTIESVNIGMFDVDLVGCSVSETNALEANKVC